MIWSAYQYREVWDDLYNGCDAETRETADRRLDFLQEQGNNSRPPISKHLDDGIFELRAKHARFLFYFSDLRSIVFVHAIIKKRSNVPREDIEIAKNRRTAIRTRKVKLNALANQDEPKPEA